MKKRRKRPLPLEPYAGLNLVPLVDLALNLVLIMLIMAPAMYIVRLPVELPKAKSAEVDRFDTIRLDLAENGQLSVEGEILDSWDALPQRLKRKMQDLRREKVLLSVDRRVPFHETSRLLNLLHHRTPITNISIGTTPPK